MPLKKGRMSERQGISQHSQGKKNLTSNLIQIPPEGVTQEHFDHVEKIIATGLAKKFLFDSDGSAENLRDKLMILAGDKDLKWWERYLGIAK